jgi:hypothetical protein
MDFLGGFAISYKLDGLFAKTPNARLSRETAVAFHFSDVAPLQPH